MVEVLAAELDEPASDICEASGFCEQNTPMFQTFVISTLFQWDTLQAGFWVAVARKFSDVISLYH